jgi:hypothetical protein
MRSVQVSEAGWHNIEASRRLETAGNLADAEGHLEVQIVSGATPSLTDNKLGTGEIWPGKLVFCQPVGRSEIHDKLHWMEVTSQANTRKTFLVAATPALCQ